MTNLGGPKSLLSKITYARVKKMYDKQFVRFYFLVKPYIHRDDPGHRDGLSQQSWRR